MAWEMVKANRVGGGVDGQDSSHNWISSWIGCTGTERRCLPAPTGAAGTNPEGGEAERVSHGGNIDYL